MLPNHCPELQTRRLWLRPLTMADGPQIQLQFPRWEIVRYLNNKVPWPYPPDGAEHYLRELALPAMERGESWHWTLRRRAEPENLIGMISLLTTEGENRGFWISPAWQRQGLMTEACEAVTEYWFEVLKMPVLRAPKAIANEASRRISQRQGMRMVATQDRDYASGRLPSEMWEITAQEWRARKAK
jgi:[ribosomal protein S5]-alanine N-acetyltransferase